MSRRGNPMIAAVLERDRKTKADLLRERVEALASRQLSRETVQLPLVSADE